MNLPSGPNSTTGGAAVLPAGTVRGRWMSQTLSWLSTTILEMLLIVHPLGSCGQLGSTWNTGTGSLAAWAIACVTLPGVGLAARSIRHAPAVIQGIFLTAASP